MLRRVTLTFGEAMDVSTGSLVEAGGTSITVRLDDPAALPAALDEPIVTVVHAANAHTAEASAPGTVFVLTRRLPAPAGGDPAIIRLAHSGYEP